jgi:hypothetical protein
VAATTKPLAQTRSRVARRAEVLRGEKMARGGEFFSRRKEKKSLETDSKVRGRAFGGLRSDPEVRARSSKSLGSDPEVRGRSSKSLGSDPEVRGRSSEARRREK